MYFESFPHLYYDFVKPNGEIDYVILKDITHNIRFKRDLLQSLSLYESYDMRDTDTPEIVSEKFYGSPFYHWIIMVANDRYDYVNDWPMSVNNLENMIREKYGIAHMYDTHHYEYNGFIVDADYGNDFGVTIDSISNHDYEVALNESKRRIRVISPQLLQEILAEFRSVI